MKYRIIFYLDIDSKDMLDDNQIEYTVKTYSSLLIKKDQYCVVVKKTDKLYQKISDDNLLSKLLGSEYQEFLDYTYRVY